MKYEVNRQDCVREYFLEKGWAQIYTQHALTYAPAPTIGDQPHSISTKYSLAGSAMTKSLNICHVLSSAVTVFSFYKSTLRKTWATEVGISSLPISEMGSLFRNRTPIPALSLVNSNPSRVSSY